MKQTHIPYAVIMALAMIILGVALYLGGLAFATWAQYVTLLPFLIGIVLNAIAFSKANDGYVTFGNVFGSGFRATAIVILIMLVWSFISPMIFPEMIDKALEAAREGMLKKGASDDQIDKSMEMVHKNFRLFMIMGVIFQFLFWGAVFSLIGGLIAKKKGNNPFEHTQN